MRFAWPVLGSRLLTFLALAALGCSLAVFAARCFAVCQAGCIAPGTTQTSGCEEESFFAVWRDVHGDPVYRAAADPPYASAYFNWAFYAFYGTILRPAVGLFGDSRLPLLGHCLTGLLGCVGAFGGAWAGSRLHKDAPRRLAGAAVGAYLFLGPLVGWWAVTLRPDVPALLLEAIGLGTFLCWHRDHPWRATTVAWLAFYAAWSFKPTSVGGLVAAALFLLVRRRWRELAVLGGGSVVLWGMTLAIGGPAYRTSLLETATNNTFSLNVGAANLLAAARALAPVVVGLPWWLHALRSRPPLRRRSPTRDALLLAGIGTLVVTAAFFVAGSKTGAGQNYFFAPGLLLTVGTVSGMWRLERTWAAPALACALIVLLQGGLLSGAWGTLSLRANAGQLAQRWTTFRQLPEPRFSDDLRLNLPWLNSHSPPLVLAYNYPADRARGRPFASGGVGGMVGRGELAALYLFNPTAGWYDGAPLDRYDRGETVAGLTVYRHRSTAEPHQ